MLRSFNFPALVGRRRGKLGVARKQFDSAVTPFLRRIRLTLEMIKFEHSIFALPFALTGALLAWSDEGFPREGIWAKLGWIVLAMVSARSVAMAFNRVLDADIDARNPRTRMRHLPAGLLSKTFAWGFIAFWVLVFLFAARQLNPLCLGGWPARR